MLADGAGTYRVTEPEGAMGVGVGVGVAKEAEQIAAAIRWLLGEEASAGGEIAARRDEQALACCLATLLSARTRRTREPGQAGRDATVGQGTGNREQGTGNREQGILEVGREALGVH